LQQGKDAWKKLADDHPDIPRFRSGLAGVYYELGRLHAADNHPGEARQAFEQARIIQENLVGEYPDIPEFARNLDRTRKALQP
jgi:hypothetical protein